MTRRASSSNILKCETILPVVHEVSPPGLLSMDNS
jgi:hypothetical protein